MGLVAASTESAVCPSGGKFGRSAGVALIVGTAGPPTIGWRGDFRNKTWTKAYEDRQAGKKHRTGRTATLARE